MSLYVAEHSGNSMIPVILRLADPLCNLLRKATVGPIVSHWLFWPDRQQYNKLVYGVSVCLCTFHSSQYSHSHSLLLVLQSLCSHRVLRSEDSVILLHVCTSSSAAVPHLVPQRVLSSPHSSLSSHSVSLLRLLRFGSHYLDTIHGGRKKSHYNPGQN